MFRCYKIIVVYWCNVMAGAMLIDTDRTVAVLLEAAAIHVGATECVCSGSLTAGNWFCKHTHNATLELADCEQTLKLILPQASGLCLTWMDATDWRCVLVLKLAGGSASSTGGRTLGGTATSSLLVTSEMGKQRSKKEELKKTEQGRTVPA